MKEDEWIEPVGEQEFVIEGAGIKRLELEQEVRVHPIIMGTIIKGGLSVKGVSDILFN